MLPPSGTYIDFPGALPMNCTFYTFIYRSPYNHRLLFQHYLQNDTLHSHLLRYGRISLFDPAAPNRTIIVKPCNLLIVNLPLFVYHSYSDFNRLLVQLSAIYPVNKSIQELDFFDYPELLI